MRPTKHEQRSDPFHGTRRQFFHRAQAGLGTFALASLLGPSAAASRTKRSATSSAGAPPVGAVRSRRARARRLIYLFQAGGPAQQDLFDYKPKLREMHGQELPLHVRGEQRLTAMSAQQASLPLAGSSFEFRQHGQSGAWVSELLPHTAKIVDKLCFVRSMWTEAINHDPAVTFFQSGSQIAGRPSMGSWISYGLGSENADLPAFVVLVSAGQGGQPLYARLWGNGFLPSRHQGVRLRGGEQPVLYLANPDGVSPESRRGVLDTWGALQQLQDQRELDPEIESRIAQYELAYRMQTSVPDATNLASEPDSTFELYGEDARKPGTFAANCLLARRLAERDVRFIQLYHQGWDQHGDLPRAIRGQATETDQASAALIVDLERRGLLDDTIVVWGGEFGRTSYCQGHLTKNNYGRDHHPRCFTMWMAGGGIRPGTVYGHTDAYSYNLADSDGNPLTPSKDHFTPGAVHVHDLHATLLHLMGIDHELLTYKHQGRRYRLTDVHGHVVEDLLA